MENLKLVVLMNNQILITRIEESPSELGEPDCKLINPYLVSKNKTIEPLFIDYTEQKVFMIHSDKIFTITEPNPELTNKYNKISQ